MIGVVVGVVVLFLCFEEKQTKINVVFFWLRINVVNVRRWRIAAFPAAYLASLVSKTKIPPVF